MSSENSSCRKGAPVNPSDDDDKCSNFEEVKKVVERSKNLWCDPDFKPCDQDIEDVEWKRPHDIVTSGEPQFIAGNTFDRDTMLQGDLNDCWLISTIADLAISCDLSKLLYRIVPPQSFGEEYDGKFKFRFWQYGKWIEVFVDDLLPVNIEDKKLMYAKSSQKNEFWIPLLEKAYAKLSGSYANLNYKQMTTALVDFTGGMNHSVNLKDYRDKEGQIIKEKKRNLFNWLVASSMFKSLMGCSIYEESDAEFGLINRHCYSITSVLETQVENHKEPVKLVRLRNPWGGETTWKGAFTPSTAQGKCLGQTGNGEFWMTLEEFVRNFDNVEACSVSTDFRVDSENMWEMETFNGKWGKTSAGGKPCLETFWSNPQYRLKVYDTEEQTIVMVALLQHRRMDNKKFPLMGLEVYKIKNPDIAGTATSKELVELENITPDDSDTNAYQICISLHLLRGDYLIIPYYMEPGQEGDFLLRILYTDKVLMENVKDQSKIKPKEEGPKNKKQCHSNN